MEEILQGVDPSVFDDEVINQDLSGSVDVNERKLKSLILLLYSHCPIQNKENYPNKAVLKNCPRWWRRVSREMKEIWGPQ